jgi:Zn-dependent peptidase ImmA (M78 family)
MSDNPIKMLDPEIALAALGYKTSRPAALGTFSRSGVAYEIAGQIDQVSRTVEISQQFPRETQYFTAAHELAHAFMHEQLCMHRDRPLNGVQKISPKDIKERQADRFATFYLMPAKLIRRYFYQIFRTNVFQVNQITAQALNFNSTDELISQCRNQRQLSRLLASTTIYNSKAIRSMSEIFNVSTEAMAIRLEELGIVEF